MAKKVKKVMGRPKKPAKDVRSSNLGSVRITDSERKFLRNLAIVEGVTLADLVRKRLGL